MTENTNNKLIGYYNNNISVNKDTNKKYIEYPNGDHSINKNQDENQESSDRQIIVFQPISRKRKISNADIEKEESENDNTYIPTNNEKQL